MVKSEGVMKKLKNGRKNENNFVKFENLNESKLNKWKKNENKFINSEK